MKLNFVFNSLEMEEFVYEEELEQFELNNIGLEDNDQQPQQPKKKRGNAKIYLPDQEFDSYEVAQGFLKDESNGKWCYLSSKDTFEGVKKYYKCALIRGSECPVRLYFLLHASSDKVSIFRSVDVHFHDKPEKKDVTELRNKVYELFQDNHTKPSQIKHKLNTKSTINSYVAHEEAFKNNEDFEQIWVKLKFNKTNLLVVCVYRPGTCNNNDKLNRALQEAYRGVSSGEFEDLLLVGDFNFPDLQWDSGAVDKILASDNSLAHNFAQTVADCFFVQHIDFPTFQKDDDSLSNTLDLSGVHYFF